MTHAKRWAGFRSILCPVDFSDGSRLALRYAAAVAARGKAVLKVVYVNDPLLVAAAAAALNDRTLVKKSAQELREFIDATLPASSRTPIDITPHVSTGDSAGEIIKAARRGHSDLIVMGTHGLTGARRLLLGSTTLSVLQQTTVPVLAVPAAGGAKRTGPPSSWPGERIAAALELDSSAGRDLDIAAHIAEWFGSSLLLIHVVEGIAVPAWLAADLAVHEVTRVAKAQRQLDALIKRGRPDVATEARVVSGLVADEIAAVAVAEKTGLLVTALSDRRGWFGAGRGSTSYHVLTHAAAPVLAYPPNWRPR